MNDLRDAFDPDHTYLVRELLNGRWTMSLLFRDVAEMLDWFTEHADNRYSYKVHELDHEQLKHELDDPHCTCNDCIASHERNTQ